jgi:prenylcysteine oxidase/farnesylcysteine lyase
VHSISQAGKNWTVASSAGTRTYDAVILAAPFHLSGISLPKLLASAIPAQPYVPVHVTLLTTTAPSPNATYLGAQNATTPPNAVFVALNATRAGGSDGPVFSELVYLAQLNGTGAGGADEYVVKLFSSSELDDAFLDVLFEGKVGWTLRHTVRAHFGLVAARELTEACDSGTRSRF